MLGNRFIFAQEFLWGYENWKNQVEDWKTINQFENDIKTTRKFGSQGEPNLQHAPEKCIYWEFFRHIFLFLQHISVVIGHKFVLLTLFLRGYICSPWLWHPETWDSYIILMKKPILKVWYELIVWYKKKKRIDCPRQKLDKE